MVEAGAPHIGSIIAIEKEPERKANQVLPAFFALNPTQVIGSGYLPVTYAPFKTAPGAIPNTSIPEGAAISNDRWAFLRELDDPLRVNSPLGRSLEDYDTIYRAARGLMYNPVVDKAMRVLPQDRPRYGSNGFGDSCIVARQALEANQGTRFIQIILGGWDNHQNIYSDASLYGSAKVLDDGVSALIAELKSSGLLSETLVVVLGEFGRTVGPLSPQNGRDHYAQQFCVFAGTGVKGGRTIGATNASGSDTVDYGWVRQRYVRPEDIEATIYSAMGIDWTTIRRDDPFNRVLSTCRSRERTYTGRSTNCGMSRPTPPPSVPFNPRFCHTTNKISSLIRLHGPLNGPWLYYLGSVLWKPERRLHPRSSPEELRNMHKPIKYAEKVLTYAARGAWTVFDAANRIKQNPSFTPKWSDKPLLKSYQKSKPPLGWPRTTDSLCPRCVPEIRQRIVDGKIDHTILLKEKVGEIKAQIIERDGRILMVKDCPTHGHFEDVMAIDTAFFKHLEEVFPGRDIPAHNDEKLHNHGTSTITHGRGSVLTVDLTNRCNMMCDPCFMDANQVGFVHELSWEDIQTLLDNAISIKPRRQMSVQFSGGEPTLSPYFLDAVRYARKVGYQSVQAATNGIEFAKSPELCKKAAEAGLRYAYLQFDGIGNAANSHRLVGNLFDVKLQAIENLYSNGVDIVPVTTIINGINNEQVGRIIQFALDNPKKIPFCSFQPVSFTGRDEAVTDERRTAQRYTLSHLAHDVKNQTGLGEPVRDWFPISFMSTFSDFADHVHGPSADWGQLSCGCHPNCGIGMAIMVDKHTKEGAPVTSFLNADRLAKDIAKVNDAGRGKFLSITGVALSLMRNYDPFKSPRHFKLVDLLQKFDKCFGATKRKYGKVTADRTMADIEKRRADRWNFLFIAGMWFQDLFNYDFRRTEQCIIPYATQEGEISFCAYNTGVGWRNIIEKMHMTATLTKWYEEHGRHEIFAGGKKVNLPSKEHSLVLDPAAVAAGLQHDLDDKGIAKTAREEKMRQRDEKLKQAAENARMAKLYREQILKEPEAPLGFVPLGAIAPAKKEVREEVGSFGD